MVIRGSEWRGDGLEPCKACGATGACEHLLAVRVTDGAPCAFRVFVPLAEARERVLELRLGYAGGDTGTGRV